MLIVFFLAWLSGASAILAARGLEREELWTFLWRVANSILCAVLATASCAQ